MKDHSQTDQANNNPPTGSRLQLKMEDAGELDKVLRGYYLGQIRQIEGRRDRRKARILIENHLVLPKSRQRTSKDAAYIQEVLGMEDNLLSQLEESRLIRRINQSGRTAIYEVSHDTLVEPILAERNNREAVMLFMRRYGRWFILLLLLLFTFGMLFENWFDVMDDSLAFGSPSSAEVFLDADSDIVAHRGSHPDTLTVPFSDIQSYRRNDSLMLMVGVNVIAHPDFDRPSGQDTISLNLGAIPLNLSEEQLQSLLETGRDTAIPLQVLVPIGTKSDGFLANVGGTTLLRLNDEPGEENMAQSSSRSAAQRTRGAGTYMVEANFGRRTIAPGSNTRSITLDTIMNLADMLAGDPLAQDLLEGKTLRLTYQVDVEAAPPPQRQVEYVPVSGIEVEYSDGTRRYIPGDANSGNQPVYHSVQPGETLFKISRMYDVSTAQIRQLNQLSDNNIQVGQVLRVR